MDTLLTRRNTALVLAALTLWRLYLSDQLQLHPDEAYYWLWSRQLDTGYFDHPPMVAYCIWLTTALAQSELWVRLSGTLAMLLVSGLLWLLAKQLFANETVAAGSVLLFNSLPLTLLGLLVVTPDVPLMLFWALGVALLWQVLQRGQAWLWYPLGLCWGLALLSKYTAVLLLPCVGLLLLEGRHRHWWRSIHPYLGLALGLLCFVPVLLWNSRHAWVSFVFQWNNGLGAHTLSLAQVGEYLTGQMLVAGPLVWLMGLAAALAGLRQRSPATLLLVCTSVPIILLFGLSSLRKVAGANWPAFAYFAFSVLLTHYALSSASAWRRRLWLAGWLSTLALSLLLTSHARFHWIPLARFAPELAAADLTHHFYGWRELGAALAPQAGQALAVTPSHQLSAEIVYYTGGRMAAQTADGVRPSQFNLWRATGDLHAKSPLFVWSDADGPPQDASAPQSVTGARQLVIHRGDSVVRRYRMDDGTKQAAPYAFAP